MQRNRMFMGLTLALLLAGGAAAAPSDAEMAPSGERNQELYWQGHESLKQGSWDQAIERFRKLEERLRKDEPAAADSAIYWQAYAQSKANRQAESRASVDRLRREFPASRWLDEADRLHAKQGKPASAGGDDDLVEAALDGLMSAPPERAIPLLRKVIDGRYPDRTKRRALFVLSQLDAEEASAMVLQVARGNGSPALRREAVHMLGISGSAESIAALEALAADGDEDVRRAVLDAFLVAEHVEGVAKVAMSTQAGDQSLRRHAINVLGAMQAVPQLEQVLAASQDPKIARTAMEALGVAGAVDVLAGYAQRPGDEALRIHALRGLGVAEGGEALARIYPALDTPKLREAALEGMMVAGDEEALLALYRAARSDEERAMILRMITITGSDGALDLIEDTIQRGEGR